MNQQKPLLVVTGASKGIGLACVKAFLAENYAVALCARNEAHLNSVCSDLLEEFAGAELMGVAADCSDPEAMRNFAFAVQERFKKAPDVLVLNAGLFIPGMLADDVDAKVSKKI